MSPSILKATSRQGGTTGFHERTSSDVSSHSSESARLSQLLNQQGGSPPYTWKDVMPMLYAEVTRQFHSTSDAKDGGASSHVLRQELVSLFRKPRPPGLAGSSIATTVPPIKDGADAQRPLLPPTAFSAKTSPLLQNDQPHLSSGKWKSTEGNASTPVQSPVSPSQSLREPLLLLNQPMLTGPGGGGSLLDARLETPTLPSSSGVTATEDSVICDRATAAVLNMQGGRSDAETELETSSSSSHQDDNENENDNEKDTIVDDVKRTESFDEGLSSNLSELSRAPTFIDNRKSSDGFSFDTTMESKEYNSDLPHSKTSLGVPQRLTQKRNSEKQSEAWKKFATNIRRMAAQDQSACSYLERQARGRGFRRNSLIQQLVLQQADTHGKYVRWTPSRELALTACADTETVEATKSISAILALRQEFQLILPDPESPCIFPAVETARVGWVSTEPTFDPFRALPLPPCDAEFRMENGVYMVYWSKPDVACPNVPMSGETNLHKDQRALTSSRNIPSVSRFLQALKEVMTAVQHPGIKITVLRPRRLVACKTFAFRRLEYLKQKFDMHLMFNAAAELEETKKNYHRDFYNVRKVDTHIHHSACMHQKHLLRFIRKKFLTESHEVVAKTRDGRPVTLEQIFRDEVGVSAWDASVDLLNVHALGSCFHRFDIFNLKYNPFGQPVLREVFLKTDNMIQGRYLAEITQEAIAELEEKKYQMVEWRLSVYGKSYNEWFKLASWVKNNKLSSKQVRWMIQVPRLYHLYRKLNLVQSFGELLRNIFEPLFDAVKNPAEHPEIYHFLLQMNGWDSVDDESIVSKYTSEGGALPLPENWTEPTNPPYSYWAYYMYANIRSLNVLLASRGMRMLPFRPHCGEAGSISHLASMYLLAHGINHGIMLRKSPVLQYLYYLHQIGLAVSPLSNNALFHEISKNPFHTFFAVGLNVSLSTDDPLMFHFTDEPLLEEYSCCAHVWKFSPVDLCEIARNSVLQSHFEPQLKAHWLGDDYMLPGRQGNNMQKTNVSNIRLQYREDTLASELAYMRDVLRLQELLDDLVA